MKKLCSLVALLVLMACSAYALETAPLQGTITGRLMLKNGEPVVSARVMFFNTTIGPPPSPDKYWRVADVKTNSGADGKFLANLPAGNYYIGVIKYTSAKLVGPPEEGDLFLPSPDVHGVYRQYNVKLGETTDIGTLADITQFSAALYGNKEPVTALEGIITDETGKPVENAMVFAVANTKATARPLFVSDKTGKDGKFLLKLDNGGIFFLKARGVYGGGKPKPKEIMAFYGTKNTPLQVTVETGKIKSGIVLRGERFIERSSKKQK